MNADEIKYLRALCDALPPLSEGQHGNCNLVSFNGEDVSPISQISNLKILKFVVLARTYLPAALDEVERLQKENAGLRNILQSTVLTESVIEAALKEGDDETRT